MRWTPELIRKRRQALGLTQQQLANQLDVTLRSVTSWERGEAIPRNTARLDEVLADGRADRGPALRDATAEELALELLGRLRGAGNRSAPRNDTRDEAASPSGGEHWVMDLEDLADYDEPDAGEDRRSHG